MDEVPPVAFERLHVGHPLEGDDFLRPAGFFSSAALRVGMEFDPLLMVYSFIVQDSGDIIVRSLNRTK